MSARRINRRVRDAVELFEGFTGHDADKADHVNIPLNEGDVLMAVGICEAIAYRTVRDGEEASYQHEFEPHAQPLLAVSSDGRHLYLIKGNYKFTHRGIEDKPRRQRRR